MPELEFYMKIKSYPDIEDKNEKIASMPLTFTGESEYNTTQSIVGRLPDEIWQNIFSFFAT